MGALLNMCRVLYKSALIYMLEGRSFQKAIIYDTDIPCGSFQGLYFDY